MTQFIAKNPMVLKNPPHGIIVRAGIIPYTVKNGKEYYLLGVYENGDYTDIGGGCKTTLREKPITCLIREIEEETDKETAKRIIDDLESPFEEKQVFFQKGKDFASFGYPFPMKRAGPVYRVYVLLLVEENPFELGGPTGNEEVPEYAWVTREEIRGKAPEQFNPAVLDFLTYLRVY